MTFSKNKWKKKRSAMRVCAFIIAIIMPNIRAYAEANA